MAFTATTEDGLLIRIVQKLDGGGGREVFIDLAGGQWVRGTRALYLTPLVTEQPSLPQEEQVDLADLADLAAEEAEEQAIEAATVTEPTEESVGDPVEPFAFDLFNDTPDPFADEDDELPPAA